ncbi:Phage integrase family protein [Pelagibacterium luteolum]|uniref:Phage integrase family protein n=2 Tax=Pelagibacterium luteolum TaxID=440168 RepID=A0A1G7TGS3_9HYPH|nr:Phage integrase family protein [Pelagibacterium luteolum]
MGYTAQIVIKRDGRVVYSKAQTFDRKPAARAWMEKREGELKKPGALNRTGKADGTLGDAIDRYVNESLKEIGKTKAQVLRSIKDYEIADMQCGDIGSADIVSFAQALSGQRKPQTVGNYLSHLGAVFAIARPAWGFPLDEQAMQDATRVCKRLGLVTKSAQRDRRPTLDELDKIMGYFVERMQRRSTAAPMHKIIAFALFSTRRQEEITRIEWRDFEPKHKRILVRDMKHPGQKVGNDVWCDLPDPAIAVIESMPKLADQIFPYSTDAISAAFTRACQFLDIKDLTFHDLRHEGVSRLFEMGMNIPHAATVSGHRSWSSLKRYTHMREAGDKYADWKWLPVVTAKP